MNSIIRRSIPAAVSATLVAGAFAIPAVATTDDTGADDTAVEETDETDATEDSGRRHRRAGLRGLEEGELAERLAAELGLDTDTVQEAIDAVRGDLAAERLAEAVEEGKLTQEQADRLTQAAEDGNLDEVRTEIRLEQLAARLAEKVEAGELTQEEADEILEAAEDGDFPGRRGRRGHRGGGSTDADTDAAVESTSV